MSALLASWIFAILAAAVADIARAAARLGNDHAGQRANNKPIDLRESLK